ncbi:sulfite exporter TauE/SafE family protein [Heliophilum fasciatum]|uniref:Probable membrane transporter protein n=1 Tax=Heliophilum fasciatum TaxID=35700 RepID=A0A4R2RWA6_9FIRM|nr:sulfite exporter TauE/SafE family protein [Heliophilum fasciatum]MCW2277433.1 putative membrane protein YfcA [Heliophilum fasciatum]TCP67269.1 hypothetical protein EDD73_105167 [Heliophilum fasciatum]
MKLPLKTHPSTVLLLVIGLIIGLVNGLIGMGGGTIAIPAMVFLLGIPDYTAHGTSLAVILPTSLISGYIYWQQGYLPWKLTATVAATGMFGAYIGARLMTRLSPRHLRIFFGSFMIVAGLRMLWR